MIDIKERHELEVAVKNLNSVLDHLYERYRDKIRVVPRANYTLDNYAAITVEVTQVIARVGE
ncbi:hypothetical protein GOA69_16285 [Sinorhizobium meliloti]|uniref:hypothetical protein n=1 Tax=Rhizobium meliloti TaxID=382 RepID=UPI00299DE8AC|nr:hypothetical protein [Sinorhizobium meliloti]